VSDEAEIRRRVRHIIRSDLRAVPAIDASLVSEEYARQHGVDVRVRDIASDELAEMFDPVRRLRPR
jgi:hypothetical protein